MAKASLSTTPGVKGYADWQVIGCTEATRPAPDWTAYLRNYEVPIDSTIIFTAPGKKDAKR